MLKYDVNGKMVERGEYNQDMQYLNLTVYGEDDEANELWKQVTDIPHERVLRFGKKENSS